MTDILTVTLNPALDVLATIDQLSDTHKMRCGAVVKHPGGGGDRKSTRLNSSH